VGKESKKHSFYALKAVQLHAKSIRFALQKHRF